MVDDADPRIVYVGGWAHRIDAPGEYNSTTHDVNAGATGTRATFKFTGTSVAVYGTVDIIGRVDSIVDAVGIQPPSSTFNVDGARESTFVPNLGPSVQYRTQFYQASSLSGGEHTLNIDVKVKYPFGSSFRLDYIEYTPPSLKAPGPNPLPSPGNPGTTVPINSLTTILTSEPQAVPSTTPVALNTVSATASLNGTTVSSAAQEGGSSSITSSTTSPLPSTADSPPGTSYIPMPSGQAGASRPSKPIGAIIGGVIGALFFLAITSVLLYIWQRKRSQRRRRELTLSAHMYPPEMLYAARPPEPPKKLGNVLPPSWSPVARPSYEQEAASLIRATDLPEYRSTI